MKRRSVEPFCKYRLDVLSLRVFFEKLDKGKKKADDIPIGWRPNAGAVPAAPVGLAARRRFRSSVTVRAATAEADGRRMFPDATSFALAFAAAVFSVLAFIGGMILLVRWVLRVNEVIDLLKEIRDLINHHD